MTREADLQRARVYLLGAADEHASGALEEAYFESAEALDTVEAAEDALIEDYLSGALNSDDRARFERHYLAAPQRRNRVETIRRLAAQANRAGAPVARRTIPLRMLAVAAALVIVAGASAAVWIAERGRGAAVTGAVPGRAPAATSAESAPTKAPVTFAFSVASATVRGAEDSPALIVPAGTDVVDLRLEGDGAALPVAHGRAVILTMDGTELWQGAVGASATLPAGVIAVASVPAARLRADDYTITLFETGASGVETERSRYFLRVRER